MADNKFYPVEIPAEDAKQGISTGYEASRTAGILYGDGQGGIRAARPGEDYGYPLIQGNGPPGGSTVANLGQHYFDMAASKPPYEYICVGYTAFGFVWTVYGDTGAGPQVLGRFSSLEALEAAVAAGLVPKPSPGDAYFIGDVAPYDMYFWDIMTQTWAYYGPLGGAGGNADVTGIPPHGDAGQVLKKLSDADYDVGWGDAVPDGSVTNAKLADSSVTDEKIANGAVTNAKIANGAVTRAKLGADALYSLWATVDTLSNPTRYITQADIGRKFRELNTAAPGAEYIFSSENTAIIPDGTELSFFNYAANSRTTLKFVDIKVTLRGNPDFIGGTGKTVTLRCLKHYDTVACDKMFKNASGEGWRVIGSVEVVT